MFQQVSFLLCISIIIASMGCEEESEPPLTQLMPGNLRVAPEAINFGTFPKGFSATREITLYNNGQIEINFDTISIDNNNFEISEAPARLGIKDSTLLSLTFAPKSAEVFETNLVFNFDGDNSPLSILITGSSVDNPLCAPCNATPSSYCIDSNTLALYENTLESCGESLCVYEAQDVLCNIGCDVQANTCISLDAGPSNNNNNPPTPTSDAGSQEEDGGDGENGSSSNTNTGQNNSLEDSGVISPQEPFYQVAQSNRETCFYCSSWDNPISCSVSSSNCQLIQSTGYGQEKHHAPANELNFTEIDNMLLRDENTGLIWSHCPNGSLSSPCNANTQPQTYAAALALCEQRTHQDSSFRLPSLGELLTIINYQSADSLFSNENPQWPSGLFWTSKKVDLTNPLTDYWTLNTIEQKLSQNAVQSQAHTLCVSAETYGEPALHTTEGIVTDTRTQLNWQKCRYGQNLSSSNTCTGTVLQLPFHEALAWCENLTLGNHSDWRLPSIRELTTLALYSEDADITSEFGPEEEGLLGQMWSATPHMTDSTVWVFNPFGPYWQKGGSSQTLRCVRSP